MHIRWNGEENSSATVLYHAQKRRNRETEIQRKKWSRKKPAKTASNKKIESQRKLAKFFHNPKQRKKKKKSSQRIERMMDKSIITE